MKTQSPNDQRSNVKNPNNRQYAVDLKNQIKQGQRRLSTMGNVDCPLKEKVKMKQKELSKLQNQKKGGVTQWAGIVTQITLMMIMTTMLTRWTPITMSIGIQEKIKRWPSRASRTDFSVIRGSVSEKGLYLQIVNGSLNESLMKRTLEWA